MREERREATELGPKNLDAGEAGRENHQIFYFIFIQIR